ncbi:hypothetical protein ACF1G0_15210 [Streptomyces sp. NPDC013953]|uniref:hypothetical protein n=1 Tax=Streptomyces sp. NPDC013953 TaxID=3364868 RepID=UPI0036FE14D9
MGRTGTTRRRALLATGALATAGLWAAGCSSGEGAGTPRTASAAERAAREEARLRRRSVAVSAALLARYDAVLAAHPSLGVRLFPLRAAVAAHTAALGEDGTGATASPGPDSGAAAPGAVTPSPGAPAAPASSPAAAADPVPQDPGAALAGLATAARKASDAHTAALADAPPEYARLLASVGAATAAQAYLLTAGRGA